MTYGLPLEAANLSVWAETARTGNGVPTLATGPQQAARTRLMEQLVTLETTRLAPLGPACAAAIRGTRANEARGQTLVRPHAWRPGQGATDLRFAAQHELSVAAVHRYLEKDALYPPGGHRMSDSVLEFGITGCVTMSAASMCNSSTSCSASGSASRPGCACSARPAATRSHWSTTATCIRATTSSRRATGSEICWKAILGRSPAVRRNGSSGRLRPIRSRATASTAKCGSPVRASARRIALSYLRYESTAVVPPPPGQ